MEVQNEIDKFHADWALDFGKKLIYRKKRTLLRRLRDRIIRPKYPVLSLYRFARHHEATTEGIVYPEIVNSDMLPKIEGLPTRFVLNEPWKIPVEDMKTLYLGPLTQGNTILVTVFPEKGFFLTIWDLISIMAILGSAIAFILLLIKAIQCILLIIA